MNGSTFCFPVFLYYEGAFSDKWSEIVPVGADKDVSRWFVLLAVEDRKCIAIWDCDNSLRPLLEESKDKSVGYFVVEKWLNQKLESKEAFFIFSHFSSIVRCFTGLNKENNTTAVDATNLFSVFNRSGKKLKLKESKEDLQKAAPPSNNAFLLLVPSLKSAIEDLGAPGWAKRLKQQTEQSVEDTFFSGNLLTFGKPSKSSLTKKKVTERTDVVMKKVYVTKKFVPKCQWCASFLAKHLKTPHFCETCMTSIQKSLLVPPSVESDNDEFGWLSCATMKENLMKGVVTIDDILSFSEKDANFKQLSPDAQVSYLSFIVDELKNCISL